VKTPAEQRRPRFENSDAGLPSIPIDDFMYGMAESGSAAIPAVSIDSTPIRCFRFHGRERGQRA
jgi:hypothetical protein